MSKKNWLFAAASFLLLLIYF
ncbi:KxYKxGKxW signal peptide domain-containing protein [Paenibacillus sp. BSR1-1]